MDCFGSSPSLSLFLRASDLLQGLRGGVLSGQECVTRRFYNPLSIIIPDALVLLPSVRATVAPREESLTRGMHARGICPRRGGVFFPRVRIQCLVFFYVFAYMRFPTAATGLRDLFDVDYGEQAVPRNEGGRDFHTAAHRSRENELSSSTFSRTSRRFVSARSPMIRSHPPYLSAGSRFACLMSSACRVNPPNKRLVDLIRR